MILRYAPGSGNAGGLHKAFLLSMCLMFFFIPLGTSPTLIAGALSLGIWLVSGRFYRELGRFKGAWAKPVFLFIALPWAGLLWSPDFLEGLDFAKKSYYWLFALSTATMAFDNRSVRVLLNSLIAGLCVLSVFSLLQFAGVIPFVEGVPTVFSKKSITSSLLLVFGLLICSFRYPSTAGFRHKAAVMSLMVLFFLALSVGIGRIGYLAFIILSPLILHNLTGRRRWMTTVVSVLVVGALFLSPTVRMRTGLAAGDVRGYLGAGDATTSVGMRFHMWKGALNMLVESPLMGAGTGGYRITMKKYENPSVSDLEFSDPHNGYLYMAASFGLPGLGLMLWLIAVMLKNGWQNRNGVIGFSIFAAVMVLAIGNVTSTLILGTAPGIMLAVFAGLQAHLESSQPG